MNPNVVIPIKNLKIKMMNLESPTPHPQLINKILSEVVAKSVSSVGLKSSSSEESEMNGK